MSVVGTSEAATILGLNESTVLKLTKANRIPARKVSGAWLYEVEDLYAFRSLDRPRGRPKKNAAA